MSYESSPKKGPEVTQICKKTMPRQNIHERDLHTKPNDLYIILGVRVMRSRLESSLVISLWIT